MNPTDAPRHLGRSFRAGLAGFVAIVVLSLGTDQVFHLLKVYPPWDQPMVDPKLLALALSYRLVYGVLGSWIAARLAPRNPMTHALALGVLGTVLSTLGALAALKMAMSPLWYPIALVVTALPCAWLGGRLQGRVERAFATDGHR